MVIRTDGIEIDRVRQIIRHRSVEKRFSRAYVSGHQPVMFRTWEALILGEHTRESLFNLLYSSDENGGPNQGYNILNVRMSMWKADFKKMEFDWIRNKRGGIVHWRLVPTKRIENG